MNEYFLEKPPTSKRESFFPLQMLPWRLLDGFPIMFGIFRYHGKLSLKTITYYQNCTVHMCQQIWCCTPLQKILSSFSFEVTRLWKLLFLQSVQIEPVGPAGLINATQTLSGRAKLSHCFCLCLVLLFQFVLHRSLAIDTQLLLQVASV